MKGFRYKIMVLIILIIIMTIKERCDGCIEEERVALLQLRSSLGCEECGSLFGDCCEWDSVECSSSSGRVTLLNISQYSPYYVGCEEWYFNASFFLPFQHLASLDVIGIPMVGCIENQGFERLSRLKRLESLSLDLWSFKDTSILSSIGTISSLMSITLWSRDVPDIQGLLQLQNLENITLYTGNNFNNNIFSLLSGFPFLRSLSLDASNGFEGTIDSTELSKLVKLEDLRLKFGNYNKGIPNVAGLSSLKTLYLDWELNGIIDLQAIGVSRNLSALIIHSFNSGRTPNYQLQSLGVYPNLKTISLSGGVFEGSVFRGFPNLTKLEYLVMRNSALNNSTLKDIGNLISLKTLRLSSCGLSGSATIQSLCKLKNLEELNIGGNELSGRLPWCIANLTSLQVLDLSSNQFTGSISTSPLRSLTSLTELTFHGNQFQVPISLQPLFNHSKLEYLDGEDNQIVYEPEDQVHDSTPRFQLRVLSLLSYSSHGNADGFPRFLRHQYNLEELDLSNIQLKGEFPHWLLGNNTKLSVLILANTSLSGPFNLSTTPSKYLEYLDVSKNSLNSTIPREIGQILPSLVTLNLAQNNLIGSIRSSIDKICPLGSLDLSYNELSGKIPEDLCIGCPIISRLILSNNNFEGPILPSNASCRCLRYLQVDNNYFSGNIPYNLLNSTQLKKLDAGNNTLSGKIPEWIANMSSLEVLDLSMNMFSGNLPTQLGHSQVKEVYLSGNRLQGSLGTAFYNFSRLSALDLSHNYFKGKVPQWIGKLPELSYLLLSHNKFEGELPIEICILENLRLVDLSNNNLSGGAPSCIRLNNESHITYPTYLYYKVERIPMSYMSQPLEFTTKGLTRQYEGSILKYMSGIDLSCNNLSGTIPSEFGNLNMIQVLNLSHNSFKGHIPESFFNLTQIESLDLSYNNLDGKIPTQINTLPFISNFNVSYNNLSGRTPEMVKQFATFENSSYVGNPFLCGPPLTRTCSPTLQPTTVDKYKDGDDEDGFIDMRSFYMTFVASYVVVLLSIGAVLYINPYWRRRWFYIIQVTATNCGYFIEDNVFPLFKIRAS